MRPILISGPAIEPVSLAEAKLWLRVDDNAQDDALATLISAARLAIEAMTRSLLITQSWQLLADNWAQSSVVELPMGPVRTVDAIRVSDANGDMQALAPTQWSVSANAQTARLSFIGTPPSPGRPVGGIEIDVTAGYGDAPGDVPLSLRQAMLLLIARWFENRGDAAADVVRPPGDVELLIAPHRRVRLV